MKRKGTLLKDIKQNLYHEDESSKEMNETSEDAVLKSELIRCLRPFREHFFHTGTYSELLIFLHLSI